MTTQTPPSLSQTPAPANHNRCLFSSGIVGGRGNYAHDLACAVLLGVVEAPDMKVTRESVSAVDPSTGEYTTRTNWLQTGDMLGRLTDRACAIVPSSPDYSAVIATATRLLMSRGVLVRAEQNGLKVKLLG